MEFIQNETEKGEGFDHANGLIRWLKATMTPLSMAFTPVTLLSNANEVTCAPKHAGQANYHWSTDSLI
jgi:hypothetical protein